MIDASLWEQVQRDILIFITAAIVVLLIIGIDVSHFAAVFEPIS